MGFVLLTALISAPSSAQSSAPGFAAAILPNTGQLDARVLYYVTGSDLDIFFTADGVVFDIQDPASLEAWQAYVRNADPGSPAPARSGHALRLDFIGARADVRPVAGDPDASRNHFFYGNDSSRWRANQPGYRTLTYPDLWEGADLVFTLEDGRLSYEIAGRAGNAALRWEGAESTRDTPAGTRLVTSLGTFVDDGRTILRTGADPAANLIMTNRGVNALLWSTLLGGSQNDTGNTLAVASNGDIIVAGETRSPNLPATPGAYSENYGNALDVFVARFADQGGTLVWNTFIGTSAYDYCNAIILDENDNPIISGRSHGESYPTTPGAYDQTQAGNGDATLTKLSNDGSSLIFSTLLGGSEVDSVFDLAATANGDIVCAGYTASSDFPTTAGCFQNYFAGPPYDFTVAIISADGSSLLASTYVGGTDRDACRGVDIDANGDIFLAGFSFSDDFPVTAGTFQTTKSSIDDAALVKMDPNLTTVLWSTYMGGDNSERSFCVDLDPAGDPIIAGYTQSSDFPTTAGALQETPPVGKNAFVAKFHNADGSRAWATYLGGYQAEAVLSVMSDAGGNPVLAGWTRSADYPSSNLGYDATHNGGEDAFVTQLAADGSAILWSTFLGSAGDEQALEVALDADFNPVITGQTNSGTFPVSPWAYDQTHNGGNDLFLARFDTGTANLALNVDNPSIGCGDSATITFTFQPDPPHTPPLRGYSVRVLAPAGLSFTPADITVFSPLAGVNDTFQIQENAPGDCTIDFSFLDPGAGLGTEADIFAVTMTGSQEGTHTVSVPEGMFRDQNNHPFDVDLLETVDLDVNCSLPNAPTLAAEPPFTAGLSNTLTASDESASGAIHYRFQWSETADFAAIGADSGPVDGPDHTFNGLVDGITYFYRAAALDSLDNPSAWSPVVSSTQDALPPVSSAQDPGLQSQATFTVPFAATDAGSGVASVELFANFAGGSFSSAGGAAASPISFTAAQGEGLYGFYTVAVDSLGNQEAAPDTAQAFCLLDLTPPTSAVNPLAPHQANTVFTLTATAEDALSGLADIEWFYQVDGEPWTSAGTTALPSFTFTAPRDGAYGFYSVATDSAGNVEDTPTEPDTQTLVDTAGPTGSFVINSGAVATNNTSVTLSIAVNDAVEMRFSNDNASFPFGWVTFDTTMAWILPDTSGTATVYGEFRDLAGNTTPLTDTIILDRDAPGVVTFLETAPRHQAVSLVWNDPDDADLDHVEIWRGLYHDGAGASAYPRYQTAVLPAPPADRAAALASSEWVLAGTAPAAAQAYDDTVETRGIYQYELFAVDAAGNFSAPCGQLTAGTNYILGDMAAPFDGLVNGVDMTYLASTYGLSDGQQNYYADADVGPTNNFSGTGLPLCDATINFEDLMITTTNYELSDQGAGQAPKADPVEPVVLSWRVTGPNSYTLFLDQSPADLKGLNLQADLPDGVQAVVQAEELCGEQFGPVFLQNIPTHGVDVGCSVLGAGTTFQGTGALFSVTLQGSQLLTLLDRGAIHLELRDSDNSSLEFSFNQASATDMPTAFALAGNHPNPFNPRTTIRFSLPQEEHVRLEIYGLDGRRMVVLADQPMSAGHHEIIWSGRDQSGHMAASGVYFYRIQAGSFHAVRKMTLMK
ncbi:hypothetical protein CSB20_03180 [bacterium DOLZORAL124_64_63]|nr:MAG: hypothetical protein CSB20_03180 [bacterium DOLZORAL124_64_63]